MLQLNFNRPLRTR